MKLEVALGYGKYVVVQASRFSLQKELGVFNTRKEAEAFIRLAARIARHNKARFARFGRKKAS